MLTRLLVACALCALGILAFGAETVQADECITSHSGCNYNGNPWHPKPPRPDCASYQYWNGYSCVTPNHYTGSPGKPYDDGRSEPGPKNCDPPPNPPAEEIVNPCGNWERGPVIHVDMRIPTWR